MLDDSYLTTNFDEAIDIESFRTMHNFVNSEDVFARIIFEKNGSLNIDGAIELTYGDITTSSDFNDTLDIEGPSTFSLGIKEESLFHKIIGNKKLNLRRKTLIEIHLFQFNNIPKDKYNPIFFLKSASFKKEIGASGEFILEFEDASGMLEARTYVDHNTDTYKAGKDVVPNTFHVSKNETYYTFIKNIYDDNVVNPVKKEKNMKHKSKDEYRKMSCIGRVYYDFPNNILKYTTNAQYDKQPISEIKEKFLNVCNANKFEGYPQLKAKINLDTKKIDLHHVLVGQRTINYFDNLDTPIYFSFNSNFDDMLQHIYVESSKDPKTDEGYDLSDTTSNQRVLNSFPHFWKRPEITDSESPNDADEIAVNSATYKEPIVTKVEELIGEQKLKNDVEIEIQMKDDEYLIDIHAGQIIRLTNYPDEYVNGKYLIKKISGIFEDTYINFSMENLVKIEEE